MIVESETQAVKFVDSGRIGVATSEADQSDISNRNLVGSSSSSNTIDVGDCVGKNIHESAIVESINSLRREVGELRLEVRKLKTTGAASSQTGSGSELCCLYVQVQCESGSDGSRIGKSK